MKYLTIFKTKYNESLEIFSLDKFEPDINDLNSFTKLLEDPKVYKYITKEAMDEYKFASVKDLAKDILETSQARWKNREEIRFLIKNENKEIVGLIGVNLEENYSGEIWYFKLSDNKSFMLEALEKALEFIKLEGLKELRATFQSDNYRTIEILEKLDFKNSGKENKMRKKII